MKTWIDKGTMSSLEHIKCASDAFDKCLQDENGVWVSDLLSYCKTLLYQKGFILINIKTNN